MRPGAAGRMKNALYNFFIHEVTMLCYRNCLQYFPPGSRILDVGIGNGAMIRTFHELIQSKNLSITGIDINRCYLDHCSNQIRRWGLDRNITVLHEPVESFEPPERPWYDSILFSMSFMLLEDPGTVLDRIRPWIKPEGRVLFFQTMFHRRSPVMELIKPRLRYLTTVDFGRVIYEDEFFALLRDRGIEVDRDLLLSRKWFAGEYRLIIAAMDKRVSSVFRNRPAVDTAGLQNGRHATLRLLKDARKAHKKASTGIPRR